MPPTDNKKITVLIVEDDTTLADMYKQKFDMEGFTTILAGDGDSGIAKAKESHPNIILLDVIMPRMDGFTTLSAIKADNEIKNIPVILLTNLGQEEDMSKGTKMGAVGYLIKANLTPAEVVNKVKEILKIK